MAQNSTTTYNEAGYGPKEVEIVQDFRRERDDAKLYFESVIKPRLDRSYKLYIADNTDRAKEIKRWQANVAVPYIHAVVETLKPRILDARPEFTVQGRNEEDNIKARRLQSLLDYTWEVSQSDKTAELLVSSSLIYGIGYLQVSWKKDVRELKFLETKELVNKKKYVWKDEERTFYDAPYVEWVDNYSLWYDWHNIDEASKQYWFKRLVLTEDEIRRRYPMADKKRLDMAFASSKGSLTDYGAIRNEVKLVHERITKGSDHGQGGTLTEIYSNTDQKMKMFEVFEWLRPFKDTYGVFVGDVPILKGAIMPNPYDFKETLFIGVPYLKIPGEYEGYGIPMILENPQIMLNMTKNQRLDAMTLNIHKMWIVNPLANISKEQLVMRPFGIVYSVDPNGAREIQMSDIKPSAYKEEDLLKSDMRYSSGVDDFSMGVGGGTPSATEVRHLRESTLERVRLFVNHLGEGYSKVMRYWISMYRQFYTKDLTIRVLGEDGKDTFPLIEKDDLQGEFDFKASVIPSIAGQNDVKKKQDMDLFQLLVNMPFIDPKKLVNKILYDWDWSLESIQLDEQPEQADILGMMGQQEEGSPMLTREKPLGGGQISEDVAQQALALLGEGAQTGNAPSLFDELGRPVNLLETQGEIPPTPRGVEMAGNTTNPRGFSRMPGAKVNTNIPLKETANPEAQLQNRALSLQR